MTSQNDQQPDDARLEHFDDPELGSGARDTGSDTPEHGQADRPVGTVDEDANPPVSDPTATDTYGGTGESPPQDTGSAIPPYEGRQESAVTEGAGGATRPAEDAEFKSAGPSDTPGGATQSPADEQPASQMPETDLDDDRVGPAHVAGTRTGESAP
ncbi:hypothetical protein A5621_13955 [Mycobacterium colombiense]|uniref:hypothetical protein n=1 Tax=Mycobacterium colombiense TaxID=339268 RepID=UPI0007EF5212|nr:hypothetical protein [Mycobacterium colombiense]OBJ37996.1 hypothetical protein A5621_13955 [Mycobacterium colombiense]OBK57162.1 hypothetical protein A5653_10580 [Mycobacterium colombiense]